jgi:transcriptional regulator with XRE-family HTH domain
VVSRGGQLIREARKRAGLTQREAAERIGTTQSVVARWENDGAAPTLDRLIEVLRTLGYDLEYFLVRDDPTDRIQGARSYARGAATAEELTAGRSSLAGAGRRFVAEHTP